MKLTIVLAKTMFAVTLAGMLFTSKALADTGPCAANTGGPLPDLIVDRAVLAQYLSVADEKLAKASCAVQEGFVSGPGVHALLRFTSSTPNIGAGALVIGNPALCPSLFFEQSTCHGHLHFREYADYRFWTLQGYDTWLARRDLTMPTGTGVNAAALAEAAKNRSLIVGRKMGFCMYDIVTYTAPTSSAPVFISCAVQGLSPGWADRYDSRLDGQYIEADTLKAGDYVLEVHVNPEQLLPETDYTNNSSAIKVRYFPKRASTPATIEVIN